MPGDVDLSVVFAYTVGLIALYLLFRLLWVPAKLVLRCGYALLAGLAAIAALNLVGSYFAFHLPLNIFSAFTVGFLGVPGIALLVALRNVF